MIKACDLRAASMVRLSSSRRPSRSIFSRMSVERRYTPRYIRSICAAIPGGNAVDSLSVAASAAFRTNSAAMIPRRLAAISTRSYSESENRIAFGVRVERRFSSGPVSFLFMFISSRRMVWATNRPVPDFYFFLFGVPSNAQGVFRLAYM